MTPHSFSRLYCSSRAVATLVTARRKHEDVSR